MVSLDGTLRVPRSALLLGFPGGGRSGNASHGAKTFPLRPLPGKRGGAHH